MWIEHTRCLQMLDLGRTGPILLRLDWSGLDGHFGGKAVRLVRELYSCGHGRPVDDWTIEACRGPTCRHVAIDQGQGKAEKMWRVTGPAKATGGCRARGVCLGGSIPAGNPMDLRRWACFDSPVRTIWLGHLLQGEISGR